MEEARETARVRVGLEACVMCLAEGEMARTTAVEMLDEVLCRLCSAVHSS